jgi:hypothetical protein
VRSIVTIASGSHASTCSTETCTSPPLPNAAATLVAPIRSIDSMLIDPASPVSSPRGPRP